MSAADEEFGGFCWTCHAYIGHGPPGARVCACPPESGGGAAREDNGQAADPTQEEILSSYGKGTPVERKNRFLAPREIITAAGETTPWICEPWVARGGVTDVAGAAKLAGKT